MTPTIEHGRAASFIEEERSV